MNYRKLRTLWLVTLGVLELLLPVCLSAATLGASVQNVRYDPASNIAWISLANNSKKFITGFSVAVRIYFADGPRDAGEHMWDFPGAAIVKQEELGSSWSGEGTIRPGEIREMRYDVPTPTSANPVLRLEATVAAIAYSDGTAEAHDGEAFERLAAVRREAFLALQKTTEISRKALANQADPNPAESALKELKQLRDRCRTENHVYLCGQLDGFIQELEGECGSQARGINERDCLEEHAAKLEHQATTQQVHSQLWRQK